MFDMENPKGKSKGLKFDPRDYGCLTIITTTDGGYGVNVYHPDYGWYNPKTGEKSPKKMGNIECLITDILLGYEWDITHDPEKMTYSIEIYITDEEVVKRLKEWARRGL